MKEKVDSVIAKHPYFLLISISLLTGVVLYSQFIFGDKILAYAGWGYDTKHSYLPSYEFWHNRIADGHFSVFDFSYGWGTNVFAVIWAIMDPFSGIPILLSLIAGVDFIGKTLVYFQILKSVCISVIGLMYFRIMGYSFKSALIPAYIMGYCGYMVVTGEHYFFSTYAFFFMMILLFTEKSMQQVKLQKGLYICIAWLASISIYALFQSALAIGIYVLMRNFLLSQNGKEYFWRMYQVVKGAILGLLLGMFSVLPQVYAVLIDSSRVNGKENLAEKIMGAFKLLPRGFVLETVSNFFSSNFYGTVNEYHGYGSSRFSTTPYFFGIFFTFSIIHFFLKIVYKTENKKERIVKIVAFCLGTVVLFSQFFIQLSNLFVYLQWRFVFVMLPFFGMICAEFLEDLLSNRHISMISFILPAFTVLLIFGCCDKNVRFIKIAAYMALFCICILELFFFLRRFLKNKQNVMFIILLGVTAGNLLVDDWIVIYGDQFIMEKEMLENGYRDSRINNMLRVVDEQEKTNFYRIDRTYVDGITPDILFSFVQPMRTLSVYNSTLSKNLVRAVSCLADTSFYTQMGYSIGSIGLKFDSNLADLFGLKYVISNRRRDIFGWEEIKEENGLFLYKNTGIDGVGLLYPQCIQESVYEKLNDIEKCFIANQYLVIADGEVEHSQHGNRNIIYQDVSERITRIEQSDNMDILYLSSFNKNAGSLCLEIKMDEKNRQGGTLYFYNQDGIETDSKECLPEESSGNIVSKVPVDTAYIKILLNDKKRNSHSYCLYECIEKNYTNSGVHLINERMSGTVRGRIDIQKDSYLLLPIPYEDCWDIKINGVTVDSIKADFGFIAVAMEAGSNSLDMRYNNRFNRAGSTISLTIWIMLIFSRGIAALGMRIKKAR